MLLGVLGWQLRRRDVRMLGAFINRIPVNFGSVLASASPGDLLLIHGRSIDQVCHINLSLHDFII